MLNLLNHLDLLNLLTDEILVLQLDRVVQNLDDLHLDVHQTLVDEPLEDAHQDGVDDEQVDEELLHQLLRRMDYFQHVVVVALQRMDLLLEARQVLLPVALPVMLAHRFLGEQALDSQLRLRDLFFQSGIEFLHRERQ